MACHNLADLVGILLIIPRLGAYIPKRTVWKESNARSLSSQINRSLNNWSINTDGITWQEKRMLITLLVKVAILALMDSTVYSFGGRIFR